MDHSVREGRRFARPDLDQAAPVAVHVRLIARPQHAAELADRTDTFCAAYREASVRHSVTEDLAVSVVSIRGGEIGAALRGGPAAHRATAVLVALITQLCMFYPALCPPDYSVAA